MKDTFKKKNPNILTRALNRLKDFGSIFPSKEPSEEPSITRRGYDPYLFYRVKGDLPFSINLNGGMYRYHKKAYSYEGTDFWRNFEEGEWKWNAQQRFAGASNSIGHYFSFTPQGAKKELQHYISDQADQYHLLHVLGSAENILDLTNINNFRGIYDSLSINKYMGEDIFYSEIISEIFDAHSGGGLISDLVGWQAVRLGYHGIIYPSIRGQSDSVKSAIEAGLNRNMYSYSLGDMFENWQYFCVVLFSGSYLLENASKYLFFDRYNLRREEWKDNPFYNNKVLLERYFDDEERLTRISRTIWKTSLNDPA